MLSLSRIFLDNEETGEINLRFQDFVPARVNAPVTICNAFTHLFLKVHTHT